MASLSVLASCSSNISSCGWGGRLVGEERAIQLQLPYENILVIWQMIVNGLPRVPSMDIGGHIEVACRVDSTILDNEHDLPCDSQRIYS